MIGRLFCLSFKLNHPKLFRSTSIYVEAVGESNPQPLWPTRASEKELQRRGEDRDDDSDDEADDRPGLSGEAGCDVIESGDVGVLFLEQARRTADPGARTDHTNFRSQLWRAMTHFPDCVEPRSRELTPLFLRFIRSDPRPHCSSFR